ncbi:MAG: glycosyltransferase [Patescibacteria group bacterium]|nr:glycosyltransferase [Patescibacteria group bacterium]
MKVAIVYDRVNKWGGAEKVLLALHEIWPEAPLYTSVYNQGKAKWAEVFPEVIVSFLQKFPFAKTRHEFYPWLTPLAFESFNFDAFDVVISVTSAEAKGIITKPHTLHICYCLTPTRYLWSGYFDYLKNPGLGVFNGIVRLAMKTLWPYLRLTDQIAGFRPDYYIAISKTVRDRIKKYYGRESEVIYPPVDINLFKIKNQISKIKIANQKLKVPEKRFFLIVSRLVPYKNIDLAIEVFNGLGWNLKIAGTGIEEERLKSLAKTNIEFLGELTEEELVGYYQNCSAVLVCGEEDFGLVSVEAQSYGKPAIVYKKGGAGESVIEGVTGLFFERQTAASLKKALLSFNSGNFSVADCQKNAGKYSKPIFQKKIKTLVDQLWIQGITKTITL